MFIHTHTYVMTYYLQKKRNEVNLNLINGRLQGNVTQIQISKEKELQYILRDRTQRNLSYYRKINKKSHKYKFLKVNQVMKF